MKINISILGLVAVVLFSTNAFAQGPATPSGGNTPTTVSQCGDTLDNDGDKLIDFKGGSIDGKKVEKDPQCTTGAICENGSSALPCQKDAAPSSASNFELQVRINNPLKVDSIEGAIQLFMNAVLRIALPFIIIFFIWSGFSFVLARGNPEKVKTAKNMFWYTIIGTLLILGAWTITNAIIGTVNSITG